jgi:hypothetical protein
MKPIKPIKAWGIGTEDDIAAYYFYDKRMDAYPIALMRTKAEALRCYKNFYPVGRPRVIPVLITPIKPKKKN